MPAGVLVAVGTAPFESDVITSVATSGLHVVRRCVDVADLLATAATRQADIALVSMALGGMDAETVGRLAEQGVVAIGIAADDAAPDATTLRRLGVADVVAVSALGSLPQVIFAVLDQGSATGDGSSDAALGDADAPVDRPIPLRDGKVVAVWGATGAPGRSVLALALAANLAETGLSTMLVDADVYGGSQAQLLGLLDESSGLLAATRSANRGGLDVDSLASHARSITPTLRILSGLPRSDRWVELSPVLLRRVLDTGRSLCRVCMVDCGFCVESDEEITYDTAAPRRNGATLEALEAADRVLVVGSADPVGLSRLLRALSELDALVPSAEPWVVVNRMRPTIGWSESEVADVVRRTTQRHVTAFLPDDASACDRAIVQGQLISEVAPNSRLNRAVGRLAHALAADLGLDRVARGRRPAAARGR
jgi:MinD-like ATPase involved in chromosome partitioning or flagellar assembly